MKTIFFIVLLAVAAQASAAITFSATALDNSGSGTVKITGISSTTNHLCWWTASSTPTTATCGAPQGYTSLGDGSVRRCTSAVGATWASLTWDTVAQTMISIIECDASSVANGAAVSATLSAYSSGLTLVNDYMQDLSMYKLTAGSNVIVGNLASADNWVCFKTNFNMSSAMIGGAECMVAGTATSIASVGTMCTASGALSHTLAWTNTSINYISAIECSAAAMAYPSNALSMKASTELKQVSLGLSTHKFDGTTTGQIFTVTGLTTMDTHWVCIETATSAISVDPTCALPTDAYSTTTDLAGIGTYCSANNTQNTQFTYGDATITHVALIECVNNTASTAVAGSVAFIALDIATLSFTGGANDLSLQYVGASPYLTTMTFTGTEMDTSYICWATSTFAGPTGCLAAGTETQLGSSAAVACGAAGQRNFLADQGASVYYATECTAAGTGYRWVSTIAMTQNGLLLSTPYFNDPYFNETSTDSSRVMTVNIGDNITVTSTSAADRLCWCTASTLGDLASPGCTVGVDTTFNSTDSCAAPRCVASFSSPHSLPFKNDRPNDKYVMFTVCSTTTPVFQRTAIIQANTLTVSPTSGSAGSYLASGDTLTVSGATQSTNYFCWTVSSTTAASPSCSAMGSSTSMGAAGCGSAVGDSMSYGLTFDTWTVQSINVIECSAQNAPVQQSFSFSTKFSPISILSSTISLYNMTSTWGDITFDGFSAITTVDNSTWHVCWSSYPALSGQAAMCGAANNSQTRIATGHQCGKALDLSSGITMDSYQFNTTANVDFSFILCDKFGTPVGNSSSFFTTWGNPLTVNNVGLPAPVITSISPTAGPLMQTVTIDGLNFAAGSTAIIYKATTDSAWTACSASGATSAVSAWCTFTGVADMMYIFKADVYGIKSVTTATTTGFVYYAYSPPTVTAISSTTTAAGVITLTGTNFGAMTSHINSVTLGVDGTGMSCTSPMWISSTSLSCTASGLTAGTAYKALVTIAWQSGVASTATITPPAAPTITAIAYHSGPTWTTTANPLTITGTNFGLTTHTNIMCSTASPAVIVHNATWVSSTTATCEFKGLAADTPYMFAIWISGVSSGYLQTANYTTTTAPTISAQSPNNGLTSAVVTFTGTNFVSDSESTCWYGATGSETAGTYAYVSATSFTCTAASLASADTFNLRHGLHLVAGLSAYTVVPAPTISSLDYTYGLPGSTFTVTGTNFQAADLMCYSGATGNENAGVATYLTSTTMSCAVASIADNDKIMVAVGSAWSGASVALMALAGAPTITTQDYWFGDGNAILTITGTNFGTNEASCSFGNDTFWTAGTYAQVNASIATCTPISTLVNNDYIRLRFGAEMVTNSAQKFTVTAAPTISAFSTWVGSSMNNITVTGTNFGASAPGTSQLMCVGSSSQVFLTHYVSSTSVICELRVADSGTSITIQIRLGTGLSSASADSYTVQDAPVITAISQSSGPDGQSVTLIGTGFFATLSQVSGTFGVSGTGTALTITASTATNITATLTGTVTDAVNVFYVTVGNQVSALSSVSYTRRSPPAISSFTPVTGDNAPTIVLTGTDFGSVVGDVTVAVNGGTCDPTAVSGTSLTVTCAFTYGVAPTTLTVTLGGQTSVASSSTYSTLGAVELSSNRLTLTSGETYVFYAQFDTNVTSFSSSMITSTNGVATSFWTGTGANMYKQWYFYYTCFANTCGAPFVIDSAVTDAAGLAVRASTNSAVYSSQTSSDYITLSTYASTSCGTATNTYHLVDTSCFPYTGTTYATFECNGYSSTHMNYTSISQFSYSTSTCTTPTVSSGRIETTAVTGSVNSGVCVSGSTAVMVACTATAPSTSAAFSLHSSMFSILLPIFLAFFSFLK